MRLDYTAFTQHRAAVRLDEILLDLAQGKPEARHAWLRESATLRQDAPDYPLWELLTSAIDLHVKNSTLRAGVILD
jgi:hypothetical protein